MHSLVVNTNSIQLPLITGEFSMIPFDLTTLLGLKSKLFQSIANRMLSGIPHQGGTAFFTLHGKSLKAGDTLRRGGAHTDGSYDKSILDWGSTVPDRGGWKVGENGPPVTSEAHQRLYNSVLGGIIMASNYPSCLGYLGEFDGLPNVGGDCSHIPLSEPISLGRDTVYYGNNHFIHESIPVQEDVHRVFARITLPANHRYN